MLSMRMRHQLVLLLCFIARVVRSFHAEAVGRGPGWLSAHLQQQHLSGPPIAGQKWDLWVVGAGELGERVARQYASLHPEARIVVETVSKRNADKFSGLNVNWRLRSERVATDILSARNLVLSFPPSKSSDFVGEVTAACALWDRRAGGRMLYTSSIGNQLPCSL